MGKPTAPARPAPILPAPTSTTERKQPPKPATPAPITSTQPLNRTLQPSGSAKATVTISPLLLASRARNSASLSGPRLPERQHSLDIPPPPPDEPPPPQSTLNVNESEIRTHRLSSGMMVKSPREWQQRWVSLQGRHMLAGKKGCEHPIDIAIQGSVVVSDVSDSKQPRFAILSANGQSCSYFLSLSQGDRTQWLTHLIEQGATVITPPVPDFPIEDSKGWLKVLSPNGSNPPELNQLDAHVQRIMEENNVRREAESLKLEALAGHLSEIELNKVKMKVSKLEADNSQMTTQLAKQRKYIADLETRNSNLLQSGPPPTAVTRQLSPATPPKKLTDEEGRDVAAKDRTIADLTATITRLHSELDAARAQAALDANTKAMLTAERDEALDLVEMVEKAKHDVEHAAEELLAQLTRDKQECERSLRQAREELATLQQAQTEESHNLRKAEQALTAQAAFEASAEELISELTRAKEVSEEKLRRAEEMLQRQSAALSLPASSRQSIFISPQLQPAQASAAELELMAEKMALLDEMCIQKEEYDELKRAYDALVQPHDEKSPSVEVPPPPESPAVPETPASVVQESQDLAAKWKQRLEQARSNSQKITDVPERPGTPTGASGKSNTPLRIDSGSTGRGAASAPPKPGPAAAPAASVRNPSTPTARTTTLRDFGRSAAPSPVIASRGLTPKPDANASGRTPFAATTPAGTRTSNPPKPESGAMGAATRVTPTRTASVDRTKKT